MREPSQLIDRAYEAAAFPELWPEVLSHLAKTVDAAGAILFANSNDRWLGAWGGMAASPDIEEAAKAYIASDVSQRSQATPRLLSKNTQGFISEAEVFSPGEWEAEPHTLDWSSKWGFKHCAASVVHAPSGEFLVFHLERHHDRPSFSRQELDCLDTYRPHLARAGLLASRWRLERLRIAAEALALIGLPSLILSAQGHVLAANALIEPMTSLIRWLPKDRIALSDPAADGLLQRSLIELTE